jgi:hypothetical protein
MVVVFVGFVLVVVSGPKQRMEPDHRLGRLNGRSGG